nr:uncharacterized protein LOC101259797 [Solanum lycopersicum]
MAICRWAGYPNLFLTFTCNPKWPEIKAMLHLIGQHDDGSRVDIICRVFQIKLAQLMQHIKKDKPFGTVIACKIFLWNTIISKIRSESKIVLPLATSGIAALLLPNGRAAHSRFHIPLDVTPESTCDIKQGSQLAELLKKTCLIIWDEAPMANKYCLEALDRSLRDILQDRYENSCDRPFGGLTIVCGGDFRQILPVIPKGTRADIVDASLNNSHLWPYFSIYELKENMRLTCGEVMGSEVERIASFDRWLLQIGDGSYYADKTMELIKLPPDISIEPSHNQVE